MVGLPYTDLSTLLNKDMDEAPRILIAGMSGYGKSYLVRRLIEHLSGIIGSTFNGSAPAGINFDTVCLFSSNATAYKDNYEAILPCDCWRQEAGDAKLWWDAVKREFSHRDSGNRALTLLIIDDPPQGWSKHAFVTEVRQEARAGRCVTVFCTQRTVGEGSIPTSLRNVCDCNIYLGGWSERSEWTHVWDRLCDKVGMKQVASKDTLKKYFNKTVQYIRLPGRVAGKLIQTVATVGMTGDGGKASRMRLYFPPPAGSGGGGGRSDGANGDDGGGGAAEAMDGDAVVIFSGDGVEDSKGEDAGSMQEEKEVERSPVGLLDQLVAQPFNPAATSPRLREIHDCLGVEAMRAAVVDQVSAGDGALLDMLTSNFHRSVTITDGDVHSSETGTDDDDDEASRKRKRTKPATAPAELEPVAPVPTCNLEGCETPQELGLLTVLSAALPREGE
jgi:hypothetical protein